MAAAIPIATGTTDQILAALRRRYGVGSWIGIEEARAGAGYMRKDSERRIDYFAIHQFPSKNNHHRIAFEVKVARGDWLKELKDPSKRRMGLMFSNEFFFVAPKGLIAPEELPPECGLMEFDPARAPDRRLAATVKAPWRDSHPPTWSFLVSVLRNAERNGE
jgi:hypothetical protein